MISALIGVGGLFIVQILMFSFTFGRIYQKQISMQKDLDLIKSKIFDDPPKEKKEGKK